LFAHEDRGVVGPSGPSQSCSALMQFRKTAGRCVRSPPFLPIKTGTSTATRCSSECERLLLRIHRRIARRAAGSPGTLSSLFFQFCCGTPYGVLTDLAGFFPHLAQRRIGRKLGDGFREVLVQRIAPLLC